MIFGGQVVVVRRHSNWDPQQQLTTDDEQGSRQLSDRTTNPEGRKNGGKSIYRLGDSLAPLTSLSTLKRTREAMKNTLEGNYILRDRKFMRLSLVQTAVKRQETQAEKHKAELWSRATILQLEEIQVAIKRSWEEAGNTQVIARSLNSCKRKTEWNGHTLLSCRDDAFD